MTALSELNFMVWRYSPQMYEKLIEGWANHIIKKFGKENTMVFVELESTKCPCIASGWKCPACEYKSLDTGEKYLLLNCQDAIHFQMAIESMSDPEQFILDLKDKLASKILEY